MRYRIPLAGALVLGCLALSTSAATAQDEDQAAMMAAYQQAGQPGMHQEQLAALVGSWEAETKFWMDPAGEPMVSSATLEYRMIMDGRYLEEIISSDFMGQPFHGRGLYGYNNVTGQLQAVWIDDMSTGIYTYSGSMNEAGDEMTLTGKYMDPVTKEWRETRSVMKISKDELHYTGWETVNGEEHKTMEITGTRKGM
jgi:hypothetical protein